MGKSILITGGARCGKSRFAEGLAVEAGPGPIYIATAEPGDREMEERIARHRARRGPDWRTQPAPLALAETLRSTDGDGPRLVDCLTLWLSNLMLADRDCDAATGGLVEALSRQHDPVILVTNEVGAGIVPENALARRFRDAAGLMNQRVAAACDEVFLCVAGCPIRIKPR